MHIPESRQPQPESFPVLIFDFDGTIGNSNAVYDDFAGEVLRSHGIPHDPAYTEELKTMTIGDSCISLSAKLSGALTAEKIRRDLEAYVHAFYANEVEPMPGAMEYLARVEELGRRRALVTATPLHLIRPALARLGLQDYFEAVVTPEMAGDRDKSFPDIYEKALALIGDPSPSDCCVFDDAPAAIRTASGLGIYTVGLWDPISPGQEEIMRPLCSLFIRDFRDLL